LRYVSLPLSFNVGPCSVERASDTVDFLLRSLHIRADRSDQLAQARVLARQVCAGGVVELASQISDAIIALLDRFAERLGEGLGIDGAFPS
jgi:hypothetical protein